YRGLKFFCYPNLVCSQVFCTLFSKLSLVTILLCSSACTKVTPKFREMFASEKPDATYSTLQIDGGAEFTKDQEVDVSFNVQGAAKAFYSIGDNAETQCDNIEINSAAGSEADWMELTD